MLFSFLYREMIKTMGCFYVGGGILTIVFNGMSSKKQKKNRSCNIKTSVYDCRARVCLNIINLLGELFHCLIYLFV